MYVPPALADFPTVAQLVERTQRTVAGLDEAMQRLAVVLRHHTVAACHRAAGEERQQTAANLILVGPTGSGKTHMVRNMLRESLLPFVEANATVYSETGYAGPDLSSMFLGFLDEPWAGRKDPKHELVPVVENFGVVVLDEFDKWHRPGIAQTDARHTGWNLQAEMLKIAEGDLVMARRNDSDQRGRLIRSHTMLFIAVGAFEGLDPVVRQRLDQEYVAHAWTNTEPVDIVKYGFREELVGRFPVIVPLPPLDVAHVRRILDEHVLPAWVRNFADDGIRLVIEESGVIALSSNLTLLGARDYARELHKITWRPRAAARPGDTVVVDTDAVSTGNAKLVSMSG